MLLLARFLTAICYLHIFLFVCLGGISDQTKTWYTETLVEGYFGTADGKAGIPIWCISMPIVVAGLCSVCLVVMQPQQPSPSSALQQQQPQQQEQEQSYRNKCCYFLPLTTITTATTTITTAIRRVWNTVVSYCCFGSSNSYNNHHQHVVVGGDPNLQAIAFWCILVPAIWYTVTNIHRKLQDIIITKEDPDPTHYTADYILMEISNAFAVTATLALALVLVPAAKHSMVVVQQPQQHHPSRPAVIATLHIWLGRIVVFGICIHGGMYLVSWKFLQGESVVNLLLPPRLCWTLLEPHHNDDDNNNYQPTTTCNNPNTDCSCYHHFRNLTGFLALLGLLLLQVSSLECVRRRSYALFYRIHVLAAPAVILMAVLHWNRIMLYIAGGVLYYWACSVPVWWEQQLLLQQQLFCCCGWGSSCADHHYGVRIVSVESIPAAVDHDACISLTIAATDTALSRYRPGQYVYLKVPAISAVAHPFSVNKTVATTTTAAFGGGGDMRDGEAKNADYHEDEKYYADNPRQHLRIIFRAMGPFTRKLEHALLNLDVTPLTVLLEGYHGTTYRIQQLLQHDVVAMIAGGIGITPYLSLLQEIFETRGCLQKVVLHWICRDDALIQYVKRHYFEPLLQMAEASDTLSEDFSIELIIHHTSTGQQSAFANQFTVESGDGNPGSGDDNAIGNDEEEEALTEEALYPPPRGVPFHPSKFAAGTKRTYRANLPLVIIYAAVTLIGMWIVWYCYQEIQDKHEVATRFWSLAGTFVWATVVSILANLLYRCVLSDDDHLPKQGTASAIIATPGSSEEDHEEQLELAALRRTSPTGATDSMTPNTSRNHSDHDLSLSVAFLTERIGRPSISDLLQNLADAQSPGLFMCGPSPLMDGVREAVGENRSIWDPRSYFPRRRRVALYEETFHM